MTHYTKNEIKQMAQDDLLHKARTSLSQIADDTHEDMSHLSEHQVKQFASELEKQYARIQRLFDISSDDFIKPGYCSK